MIGFIWDKGKGVCRVVAMLRFKMTGEKKGRCGQGRHQTPPGFEERVQDQGGGVMLQLVACIVLE